MKVTVENDEKSTIRVHEIPKGKFAVCVGFMRIGDFSGNSKKYENCIVLRPLEDGVSPLTVAASDESSIGEPFLNESYLFQIVKPKEFIVKKV